MRKLAWLVPFALAACGTTVTSVDGDKHLQNLSPSEGDQLCEDIANYVSDAFSGEELARIACGFAVSEGASCKSDFNDCVAHANVGTPIADTANCDAFRETLKSCDATVGQFADCVTQMVDALGKLEQEVPLCSQQAQIDALVGLESDLSSECITLFSKCQVSFGGTSSSSPVR
jgi:hypothetical protein